jgi:hypothetical protein
MDPAFDTYLAAHIEGMENVALRSALFVMDFLASTTRKLLPSLQKCEILILTKTLAAYLFQAQ